MKKLILVAIVVLFSTTTFAQGLDLGLKAGVNFANINDVSGDLDGRTGFVVGAFVGGKFNDKIGMQADLLYSQQGADFDIDKIDLNYVNVPVVIKYFLVKGLHIHAGPQFGFVVDDNLNNVFMQIGEAESFDLSGVVGVGYDLPLGLRIDARYNFGLTEIGNEGGKNSVVTLSLGYSFL